MPGVGIFRYPFTLSMMACCRNFVKTSVGSWFGVVVLSRSMVILLQDDLVDSCKAGDDVVSIPSLPLLLPLSFDICTALYC